MTHQHAPRPERADPDEGLSAAPSPAEALRLYRSTARLVELQLELARRGRADDRSVAAARAVLLDTRRVLLAALGQVESPGGTSVAGRE